MHFHIRWLRIWVNQYEWTNQNTRYALFAVGNLIKVDIHIIPFFVVIIIAANFYTARQMILPAYELGFTNGDYAFITFELDYNAVLRSQASPQSWFLASSDGTDRFRCKFQEGFESVLTLALDVDESRGAFDIFQTDVKKRSPEVPFPNSTAYQGYIFDNPSLSPLNTTTVSIRFLFLTDRAEKRLRLWWNSSGFRSFLCFCLHLKYYLADVCVLR